ncbi:tRNA lysidine(34) synthetase TilS [Roseomonas sp. NAR14]|uniref:tRNA(Ile)-lysidine synthase n=1 Tax=Roseomonas acroporae TaxID=2937791 RepID=A0A9X1Y7G1_9PROT|nr:tRNA lysidine(34) synthetase TilS [Roseomonas acroporae]MCK8785394.1 tRNA lysidine(34) synthetase TilS [Roseomonas acroporae]
MGAAEFAALMRGCAPTPWPDATAAWTPRLAAGVSGGPDSLALALLAHDWVRSRGGTLLALVADHGLRPESAAEAAGVVAALAGRGIASRLLRLGLPPGPALQERARAARHAALLEACREAGIPWLLLGHQRDDQAETVLFRALRGSGGTGLAGMAPWRSAGAALVLRPLLGVPRTRLEATVAAAGLLPVRDPSNDDPRFARARLRAALAGGGGTALAEAALAFARRRGRTEAALAERLALAAEIRPEGFCRLDPAALGTDPVAVAALRALLRTVAGAAHAPAVTAVRDLLARARMGQGGTLGGALLRPAGGVWLLLREAAAIGPDVPAVAGACWDGRFRQSGPGDPACRLAPLGTAHRRLGRVAGGLPPAVLRTLPAVWRDAALVAVPLLDHPTARLGAAFRLRFAPAAGPAA